MTAICVIPARGGSKRIPRKNIRSFHGRPMIEHAIACATQTGLFDDVLVSTDDREIASVAEQAGARVPFVRDKTLSDDVATTVAVIGDAAEKLQKSGMKFDHVCCLYPCTPLLDPVHIKSGFEFSKGFPGRFSFPLLPLPIHPKQALVKSADGSVSGMPEAGTWQTSQEFETVYQDAGQFYWGRTDLWLQRSSIHKNAAGFEIKALEAVDINTEDEWQLAEYIYAARSAAGRG